MILSTVQPAWGPQKNIWKGKSWKTEENVCVFLGILTFFSEFKLIVRSLGEVCGEDTQPAEVIW